MIGKIILILAGLAGFLLAGYLRHKKKSSAPLVCPLKADCATVIHSDYAKFFGLPVEVLGSLYYALVAISYSLFLIFPTWTTPTFTFVVLVLSTAAFLFSLYLTFIQLFALRKWCSWCLLSAGLCTIIFVLTGPVSNLELFELLINHQNLILLAHVFGLTLGLGGATIVDIFYFKFLKDRRISEGEAEVLNTLSQVIWFGLAILVTSGLALYLPQAEALNQSAKFLTKVIIVGVIILNGAALNLVVAPRLVKMSFRGVAERPGERRLTFALGAVSLVSWYSAFVLGASGDLGLAFGVYLLIYSCLLALAIVGSQLIEYYFTKQ